MVAATAAAVMRPRPVAVAPRAAAATVAVVVAVPKDNAEPGLVSLRSLHSASNQRQTAAVAARDQAEVPNPAVRVRAQYVSATESQEELSETYVATSRRAITRSPNSAVSRRPDPAQSLLSFRLPCAGSE